MFTVHIIVIKTTATFTDKGFIFLLIHTVHKRNFATLKYFYVLSDGTNIFVSNGFLNIYFLGACSIDIRLLITQATVMQNIFSSEDDLLLLFYVALFHL